MKIKHYALIIILAIIFNILFFNNKNIEINALQNENDVYITMDCQMNTNSTELNETLMINGSYQFWNEPQLNLGNYSHESQSIEISDIKHYFTNQSSNSSVFDNRFNQSIITTQLTNFEFSEGMDIYFDINIEYDILNHSYIFDYDNFYYEIMDWGTSMDIIRLNDYYYICDMDYAVYRYNLDFTGRTLMYQSSDTTLDFWSLTFFDNHIWIIDDNYRKVYKLNDDFTLDTIYTLVGSGETRGICNNGTNLFISDDGSSNYVYVYDKSFSLVKTYTISQMSHLSDINYDGEFFYFTDYDIGVYDVWVYTKDFIYTGLRFNKNAIIDYASMGFYFDNITGNWLFVNPSGNDKIYVLNRTDIFCNQINITYQILGINYTDSLNLTEYEIIYNSYTNVIHKYRINSSQFIYYNYTYDVIIPTQIVNFVFNNSLIFDDDFWNFTIIYNGSISKVPTEVNLKINNINVLDLSYNSGILFFYDFQDWINITSDITIEFKLNIELLFSFINIPLEIISKSYLHNNFKLLSNFKIYIEFINFDIDLDLKKVYLNSILRTIVNNTKINPNILMIPSNIFYLDIILDDYIYKQLTEVNSTQITNNPSTDINSINFINYFNSSTNFEYWFMENNYDILSIEMNHYGKIISDITIENNFYYFKEGLNEGEIIEANIIFNPNWDIILTITFNNGTYANLKIRYKADFSISNVSLILDLSSYNLYAENWNYDGIQNIDTLTLIVPNINFSNSYQTINLIGVSDIPLINYTYIQSEISKNKITQDSEVAFQIYLQFNYYTQTFYFIKSSDWSIYQFYYGNMNYSVQTISSSLILVEGEGFDPSINDSWLFMKTKPFTLVNFTFKNELITIEIDSTLLVNYTYFLYLFIIEQTHTLNSSDLYLSSLTDTEISNYLYFERDFIPQGKTIIYISLNYTTIWEIIINSIIIFAIAGAFIGVYYYLKRNEKAKDKISDWVNEKVVKKLEKDKDEKGFESVELSVKENKIIIKGK